ncbi:MAG: UDP-N-acetylmuramate dehydrogenase [Candidatus Vogelbacteria bacterium]|nr:UDP-N-acetylmuramate dehydrogenase [Candidatus Vogelbacteria bacterium]
MEKSNLTKNEPLFKHTTFQLGGLAKYFLATSKKAELIEALALAQKEKLKCLVIGGGSNTVFSDKGFNGLVIKYGGGKLTTKNLSGTAIDVDASVSLWELVTFSIKNGLSGLEYLSGIPGNVGGAIVGNAGAYDHFIGDLVESVEISAGQKVRQLSVKDCHFLYRDSIFKKKDWIILSVRLNLKNGDKKGLSQIAKNLIKDRNKKYDGLLCAGSFFKNIPLKNVPKDLLKKIDQTKIVGGKLSVGYLLGEAGAGGLKAGGISVSSFHHNFLINDGSGKASDLKKLATKLKSLVKKKFNINLEEEVRLIK